MRQKTRATTNIRVGKLAEAAHPKIPGREGKNARMKTSRYARGDV